jgi:hypothetical protein
MIKLHRYVPGQVQVDILLICQIAELGRALEITRAQLADTERERRRDLEDIQRYQGTMRHAGPATPSDPLAVRDSNAREDGEGTLDEELELNSGTYSHGGIKTEYVSVNLVAIVDTHTLDRSAVTCRALLSNMESRLQVTPRARASGPLCLRRCWRTRVAPETDILLLTWTHEQAIAT